MQIITITNPNQAPKLSKAAAGTNEDETIKVAVAFYAREYGRPPELVYVHKNRKGYTVYAAEEVK